MLETIIKRNLLKYAAGRAIQCQCGAIADWRHWVIVERPDGSIAGNCCDKCYDTASDGHNLPAGYTVTRHGKPKKAKPAGFPTSKKALDTALRRDIHSAHKRMGNCTKTDRLFPEGYGTGVSLVETEQADGSISIWWKGDPNYSRHQVDNYVRLFCELNHLKG